MQLVEECLAYAIDLPSTGVGEPVPNTNFPPTHQVWFLSRWRNIITHPNEAKNRLNPGDHIREELSGLDEATVTSSLRSGLVTHVTIVQRRLCSKSWQTHGTHPFGIQFSRSWSGDNSATVDPVGDFGLDGQKLLRSWAKDLREDIFGLGQWHDVNSGSRKSQGGALLCRGGTLVNIDTHRVRRPFSTRYPQHSIIPSPGGYRHQERVQASRQS